MKRMILIVLMMMATADAAIVEPAAPSTGDLLKYDGTNWVAASGYVHSYDWPSGSGWSGTNIFTCDNNYHTLDISTNILGVKIVPADAKGVFLRVALNDDTVGSYLRFRKQGYTNSVNVLRPLIQVANVTVELNGLVGIGTNGLIEYNAPASLSNASLIYLVMTGYTY